MHTRVPAHTHTVPHMHMGSGTRDTCLCAQICTRAHVCVCTHVHTRASKIHGRHVCTRASGYTRAANAPHMCTCPYVHTRRLHSFTHPTPTDACLRLHNTLASVIRFTAVECSLEYPQPSMGLTPDPSRPAGCGATQLVGHHC